MKYLDFLKVLIALGPKLQTAWPIIMAIIAKFQELAAVLSPNEVGGLELVEPTDEELAAEAALSQALAADGTQAVIDFGRIRGLVKLAKDLGLLDVLIGLIAKATTGA